MHRITARAATLLAVPALTLTALAATSAPASAAVDPTPVDVGASWLSSQLTDGIVHNDQYDFDDIGLSADVGLGLAAVGGHDDTVHAIAAAVEPRAHDEWYTSTYDGVTTLYAGSLAKAAVFAQTAGADPTDFGGEDLISELEGTVSHHAAHHRSGAGPEQRLQRHQHHRAGATPRRRSPLLAAPRRSR